MTADAFVVALATERTRTARLFNRFRFVGVSAADVVEVRGRLQPLAVYAPSRHA